jgi:hypothetical protein
VDLSVGAVGGAGSLESPLLPGGASFVAAQQVLGMSGTSLRVAMQSGQRLADIAASKGLDRAAFITEIANTLNRDRPQISAVLANALATRAAGAADSASASAEVQAPATELPASAHPPITEMPATAKSQVPESPRRVKAGDSEASAGERIQETETLPRERAQRTRASDETRRTHAREEARRPQPSEERSESAAETVTAEGEAPEHGARSRPLLQQLSGMFKMSQQDLVQSWSNGATPIQIAVSRGIAPADLLNAFEHALKQSGSPSLSRRAGAIAETLAASPLLQGSLVSQNA